MTHDRTPSGTEPTPLRLNTADGLSLEAEIHVPDAPRGAILLAHPHPLHGGSMRSLVTSELFRALPARGLAVLRFNFRGVEGSEGEHGGGVAERHDVIAAIDALEGRAPVQPLVLAGWSFGGDVSLTVTDERLAGWFLLAPTLRILPREAYVVGHDDRPKLIAVPEHDAFCPPDSAREATASWTGTTLEVIAGADHFLVGRTAKAAELLIGFVDQLRVSGR
jgi:uncharacterized protein